jgi:hypothetical protein
VLTFAAFYLARLYNALAQWKFLAGVLPFSPAYLAVTGLVWGLVGLCLAFALLFGWRSARRLFWAVFLGHGLYFWLDRFLLPGSPERSLNNPFWIVVFILVGVLSLGLLHRRACNAFFVRDFGRNIFRRKVSGAKYE